METKRYSTHDETCTLLSVVSRLDIERVLRVDPCVLNSVKTRPKRSFASTASCGKTGDGRGRLACSNRLVQSDQIMAGSRKRVMRNVEQGSVNTSSSICGHDKFHSCCLESILALSPFHAVLARGGYGTTERPSVWSKGPSPANIPFLL